MRVIELVQLQKLLRCHAESFESRLAKISLVTSEAYDYIVDQVASPGRQRLQELAAIGLRKGCHIPDVPFDPFLLVQPFPRVVQTRITTDERARPGQQEPSSFAERLKLFW